MNSLKGFDPLLILQRDADLLNACSNPAWFPKVSYEIMSGALIWSDEWNQKLPWDTINALRIIFAYRTSLMLGKPRDEFAELWNQALGLFPDWIGFLPARRKPTRKLLRIYQQGETQLKQSLSALGLEN